MISIFKNFLENKELKHETEQKCASVMTTALISFHKSLCETT